MLIFCLYRNVRKHVTCNITIHVTPQQCINTTQHRNQDSHDCQRIYLTRLPDLREREREKKNNDNKKQTNKHAAAHETFVNWMHITTIKFHSQ